MRVNKTPVSCRRWYRPMDRGALDCGWSACELRSTRSWRSQSVYNSSRKSVSKLQSVTCHISVARATCRPTQVSGQSGWCRGKFVARGKFFPPPYCHNVTNVNPNPKFNPILNLNPNPYCWVWE